MERKYLMPIAGLLAVSCSGIQKLSPEERAEELVAQMTIEQKAQLMLHPSAGIEELGIPAYNWWNEALHGVARNGKATVFPQPIGMAAAFDEILLQEVFTAVSDEARVKNRQAVESGEVGQYQGLTFWTPNINIFRDPRWGRGMETYGEDPYLTGMLGMAVVRGLQGSTDAPVLKAHACAKHFAVHSGPEWNRHSFNSEVSERDLRETYLPAFKDLVTKTDVQEVMVAYNRFRGTPCAANEYLIKKILRGEWGFRGLVTSDCWAITDFFEDGRHNYSSDAIHAAAAAIRAGTDLNCGTTYAKIPEAVAAGLIHEEEVDKAVVRLLAARIRLGELDRNIEPWAHLDDSIVEGEANRALARRMAQESLVLLQNKGNILPLQSDMRLALVGPNADDREMQWGNYNGVPDSTTTLADALRARFPDIIVVRGCGHVDEVESDVLQCLTNTDVVIFAGGISPKLEGEDLPNDLPGFKGGDRTTIELPDVQRQLLRRLHEAGKKVVLVNFSGSAMGLEPETASCDAILQAWYPGQEGGAAICDILFGDVSPSGKLPITFYRNDSQMPDFEDYAMQGRTYRYFQGTPLFPFGFGLTYSTFEYGPAKVSKREITIPVTNTGERDATETVQLYVHRPSDTRGPLKTLRAFCRVHIPAGQTTEVTFTLTADTFLGWSEEKQDVVTLPGEWELFYGSSSDKVQRCTYEWK